MPKIKAKFRRRNGVPYTIENFCGKQFRCRHCNEIFFREKELDVHLRNIAKEAHGKNLQPHRLAPQLNTNVLSTLIYTFDVEDRMKKQWLKLKKGDVYDGL